MLLAFWPLFQIEYTMATDTPELEVVVENTDIEVISVDEGEMIVRE